MPRDLSVSGHRFRATARRVIELFGAGNRAAAQIDHRSAVLRFTDARARWHERIREALADRRDHGSVQPFPDHLGLDRVCTPFGEGLIVTERTDRIGMTG